MLRSRKIRVSGMLLKIFCYKFAVLCLYLILAIIISDSVDLQDFCKLF